MYAKYYASSVQSVDYTSILPN